MCGTKEVLEELKKLKLQFLKSESASLNIIDDAITTIEESFDKKVRGEDLLEEDKIKLTKAVRFGRSLINAYREAQKSAKSKEGADG